MARVLELHKVGVSYNDCKKIFKGKPSSRGSQHACHQLVLTLRSQYLIRHRGEVERC